MKILWLCAFFTLVYSENDFGTAYLRKSQLCHQWSCLNTKLGLPDALPPRDQSTSLLRSLLPEGPWQDVVDPVIEKCYNNRPRKYTNTCPGQALLQCMVEHLIQFCPPPNLREKDACAPVSSTAGWTYMFSQSRYENFEQNILEERSPSWFMRHYFSSRCCNLPQLISQSDLTECGFTTIMHYYMHTPRHTDFVPMKIATTTQKVEKETVEVVDISQNNNEAPPAISDPSDGDRLKVVALPTVAAEDIDPMDCCDLSKFMEPTWRSECDFQLSWTHDKRLTVKDSVISTTEVPTTTTAKPVQANQVKLVPDTCEKETCVFSKLNLLTDSGIVDRDAFSRLLDNMTNEHPSWVKAKARVATQCLNRSIIGYDENCDVNKLLSCVFDVFSENCPHTKKEDPCKHTKTVKDGMTCQISTSKYRAKNRRTFCGLPNMVNHKILSECGMTSLSRMVYVQEKPYKPLYKKRGHWWNTVSTCKDTSPSTRCVLKKMDILNKYSFMDYFKIKDRIRNMTQSNNSPYIDASITAFNGMPLYKEYCSTQKKLLNVLDVMIRNCPVSKRKHTLQCNRVITDMTIGNQPSLRNWSHNVHFDHVYLPNRRPNFQSGIMVQTPLPHHNAITKKSKIIKNPEFDFGILNSKDVPPVQIIDLKKSNTTPRPIPFLWPIYMRSDRTLART